MGNCCKGTSFSRKRGEYTLPPEVVDDTPIVKNNASFRKSKAILDLNPLPTNKANESSTEKDQTMALVSYQQSPKIQIKSVVHSDQDDALEIHTAPNEGKLFDSFLVVYLQITILRRGPLPKLLSF